MKIFEPINEIELKIYKYIQNLLKSQKHFNLKKGLNKCYIRFENKYSHKKITKAVHSLIQKRYIIEGSSLTRDDIITNVTRKKIFGFIQKYPGAYNRLIRRELNIGSHEFNWHTGMLQKFGFIKKIQFGRSYGYFKNKSFMDHEYDLYLLQNEKVTQIIHYLENHQSTLSQISNSLNIHYSTIQKYLKIMEKRELVIGKKSKNGKHKYFNLNSEIFIKLRKIINGQIFIEFA